MHILLIHQYFLEKNDGGGSRFNEMTKKWVEEGHRVTILAGMVHYTTGKKPDKYKGKYFFKDEYDKNITVWRCHVSKAYNKNFIGRLWGYFSFVVSSIWAGLFLVKGKFNVALVTSPPLFLGLTGRFLSFWKRIPLVFEVRDLWPESAIDTGVVTNKWVIKWAYWFEKRVYRKSALINALTPAFKTKIIAKGISEDKVVMIPNAADFSLAEKVLERFDMRHKRKELGWENKFVAIYIGAHGVANHLSQMIEAAKDLQDTNFHMVFVGSGMQKEMLQELTNEYSLKNVEFIDPVPKSEVFQYVYSADIGATILKKVDTFKTIYANKTFDYMSCKTPVLLCVDGVSRELVEKANCGIYAEPENIPVIIDKVKEFMAMPEDQIRQLGINGYDYAKKNFDRTFLADKYLKEIEKVSKK